MMRVSDWVLLAMCMLGIIGWRILEHGRVSLVVIVCWLGLEHGRISGWVSFELPRVLVLFVCPSSVGEQIA